MDAQSAATTLVERHREDAENPDWENRTRVHDWRNYMTEEVRAIWSTLSIEARCAIIDCCEASASGEVWD